MQTNIEKVCPAPGTECYRVILFELRNDEEFAEPGNICGTFLSHDEAFRCVGFFMMNDIQEYGRADVYQIMHLDSSGEVLRTETFDNETSEPTCYKPTYPIYGCQGCTECKDKEEDYKEILRCPSGCPWFDATTEGCQGCSKLSECVVYSCLKGIENALSQADSVPF